MLANAKHRSQGVSVLKTSLSLIAFAFSLVSTSLAADTPLSISGQLNGLSDVPVFAIAALDRDAMMAEDARREGPGVAPRFAVPHPVALTPQSSGAWDQAADGRHVWRLRIQADQARSISLGFTRFHLPDGAHLQIFGQGGKHVVRPFTARDNHPQRELWTPVVPGDELVIELVATADARNQVELELGSINYGYRGFFEPAAERSGSCNVDVVCPEGEGWEDQIASVAVISTGGGTFCTGFMVNNAENDDTPFFMTAAHCGINSSNAASLVAYWNFENSYCRIPNTGDSGGTGDGNLSQFTTGAIHRARLTSSDFTLVEFNNEPDEEYGVFYAGWDVRDQATSSAIAIHHPSTNEKRISFENDPTTITTYLSSTVTPTGTHIRVADWDVGTTEPGSSGSPLFSPEGRVIGQLHGGFAACSNNDDDWYGRMFVSWDRSGADSSNRLRDWLDPNSTSIEYIDGKPQGDLDPTFELSANPQLVSACSGDPAQVDIGVRARWDFDDEVTLSINGLDDGITAQFAANPVTPEDPALIVVLTLDDTDGAAGTYSLTVTGNSNGPGFDPISQSTVFNLMVSSESPAASNVTSPADNSTGVGTSPLIEWAATVDAVGYTLQIATDASFTDVVYSTTTDETNHQIGLSLSPDTTYFVRVQASNDCGNSDWSETTSFTTATEICVAPGLSIPDNNPTGVSSDIEIATAGKLEAMALSLDITHTWVGDLIITLTHVDSATTVNLVNRAIGSNATFGCSSENIDVTIADGAPVSLQTDCVDGGIAVAYPEPVYSPNSPLAAFNGQDVTGTWRLNVSDNAGGDLGTFNQWCLMPSVIMPAGDEVFDDRFEALD